MLSWRVRRAQGVRVLFKRSVYDAQIASFGLGSRGCAKPNVVEYCDDRVLRVGYVGYGSLAIK